MAYSKAETMKVYEATVLKETKNYSVAMGKKFKKRDVLLPNVAAAATNTVVSNVNLTNNKTDYTIAASPDVPRNIQVKVVDTTPSITGGTVVVEGTDINGNPLKESFAFTKAATKVGSKIFKTVTKVSTLSFATLGGSGDEKLEVGCGVKIGLPVYVGEELVKVLEATKGGTSEVANCTVNLDGKWITFENAPNGTYDYEVIFEVKE